MSRTPAEQAPTTVGALPAAAYDPLHNPGQDRTPDVHTVDLALHQARAALDHCATANIHSHGEMMTAATELDFVLRQLVAALDAERGERR